MFKIGEFSRFTRVTVKALRFYDEIGLFEPSFVDPGSGYRYYRAEQLPRLNRILALKDLGFSLEAIRALVDAATGPEQRAALFRERRAELGRAIEREAARLRQLDAIESGAAVAAVECDVVLRAVAPCLMAVVRRRVTGPGDEVTAMFEALEVHAAGHRAPQSPLLILHDEEYRETDLDLEAAVPLTGEVAERGEIRVREVEGCPTMACAVYRGGYEQTGDVLNALCEWTDRHGMRIAGPAREVYLRFGADQQGYRLPGAFLAGSASEYITEIQLPLANGDGT
jgi:DNA-binding transcriptional MerR regulator/effector-binding domain-containing protein